MTAHPKTDPATGELHFFGYGFAPPFLTYHRLSAAGELVTSAEIAVPGPTMMHDFAITDRHAVFLDLPMTFSLQRLATGMPYGWDDSYGARLGVMPLDRPGEARWFDVDPAYVFHVGNAHTDDAGRVVLDAARYAAADAVAMWDNLGHDPAGHAAAAATTGAARLHRWVLDPATGAVTETPLADRSVEFPTVDDARVGRDARYRYAVTDTGDAAGIVKFDAATGAVTEHAVGAETVAGEAVFVPTCRGRPRGGRRLAAHDHHPARRQRVAAAGAGRDRRRRATGGGRDAAARGAVGLPRVLDRGRRAPTHRARGRRAGRA